MMMSELPWDLIEEILCRVEATSLNQLRSTCKGWNNLFNNGRFTRKHFERASKLLLVLMLRRSRVCSVEFKRELSLIVPQYSSLDQFEISQVSHYEGLLLCTHIDENQVVLWNPCTGQTRWIPPIHYKAYQYALGSCQDNKSKDKSYKILSYRENLDSKLAEFAIYDINSSSWRILDITRECYFVEMEYGVSLKGNTYWFASDERHDKQLDVYLVGFDYTTERFEHRIPLPCKSPCCFHTASLSVVREEKLSVLLQRETTSRTEIWVTNKIGEAKVVSWNMVLALDLKLNIHSGLSFLVEEEEKVLVCCDKYFVDNDDDDESNQKNMVYIVGEDNKVTQLDFGPSDGFCWPFLFNYVPSLTQIQQLAGVGGKRKRNDP